VSKTFGTGASTSAEMSQFFETLQFSALVPKCPRDTLAPVIQWVRSVLGPKCPYTDSVTRNAGLVG